MQAKGGKEKEGKGKRTAGERTGSSGPKTNIFSDCGIYLVGGKQKHSKTIVPGLNCALEVRTFMEYFISGTPLVTIKSRAYMHFIMPLKWCRQLSHQRNCSWAKGKSIP